MKSQSIVEPDNSKVESAPEAVSAADLAKITGKTVQGIRLRARNEGWKFSEIEMRGGRQKLFPVAALPVDIRRQVLVYYGEVPEHLAECVPGDFDPEKIRTCTEAWDQAREWQREFARDRHAILQALDRFRAGYKAGRRKAVDRFVRLYRDADVPGLDPEIYGRVRRISRTQIYEWQRRYGQEGIAGLLSRNGHAKGKTLIPVDQQRFILHSVADQPTVRATRIETWLRGRFGDQAADRRQVVNFLRAKREQDPSVFTFLENPDAYRSKYQLALGDASEKAQRFLHYVEVDSTPADVLCSDGKRYNITGLIDVFSRKAKFQVTRTSNSWAIAAVLRSTIMDWGIPECVVRDNGQDYASRMTNDALRALQVEIRVLPPFTPQGKPHVERVFRTLSHGLMEILPGYIGHCVADRQAIESRRSFAERLGKRGETVDAGMTPRELQESIDTWTEQVYHQRRHGSLGASPNARQASCPNRPRRIEDPRALDLLLAPTRPRRVGKKGIRYDNGLYWSDDLIDWIGRDVIVRTDVRDAGRIYCFCPSTHQFIAEAQDMALGGITLGGKIAAKKRADKRVRERAKALKRIATETGSPFEDEIAAARQDAGLFNLPVGEPVQGNPFVDAAFAAVSAEDARHGGRDATEEAPLSPPVDGGRQEEIPPNPPFSQGGIGDDRQDACPTEENPNVIPIARKQVLDEPLYFDTARERFDHFRVVQRTQEVSEWDIKLIVSLVDEWFDWADQFSETWPESDRRWLGRIAPDHFPHYVEAEYREDGK